MKETRELKSQIKEAARCNKSSLYNLLNKISRQRDAFSKTIEKVKMISGGLLSLGILGTTKNLYDASSTPDGLDKFYQSSSNFIEAASQLNIVEMLSISTATSMITAAVALYSISPIIGLMAKTGTTFAKIGNFFLDKVNDSIDNKSTSNLTSDPSINFITHWSYGHLHKERVDLDKESTKEKRIVNKNIFRAAAIIFLCSKDIKEKTPPKSRKKLPASKLMSLHKTGALSLDESLIDSKYLYGTALTDEGRKIVIDHVANLLSNHQPSLRVCSIIGFDVSSGATDGTYQHIMRETNKLINGKGTSFNKGSMDINF